MARREGIALCLSGGGFRSALFHLGALRRLFELGLLHEVALVSSVSGGSILSGFFAERVARASGDFSEWLDALDWEREIGRPFRAITSHDLRTGPVLKNCLWNWLAPGPRMRDLERAYSRRVSERKLSELPVRPEFTFCATNLTFGVNWEFTRQGGGDYQAGYLEEASEWPLARAIAASSAFPPVFGPLPIRARAESYRRGRYSGKDRDRLVSKTALSDGGVYDNMGLEPAWKEYETVLVSDCGAPFDFSYGTNPIRRLFRYTSVVMNQASSVRKRFFFDQLRRGEYAGTYWGIRSADDDDEGGYSRELVDGTIAEIRTDLDAFTEAEQKILENHGYFAANRSLTRHLRAPLPREVPAAPPHPEWLDETLVRKALATSARRISIRRWFQVLRERRRR
jgi:NTE family protein